MNILEQWDFAPDIQFARVEKFDEQEYKNLANEVLGFQHPFLMWSDHLTDEQKAKLKQIRATYENQFSLKLAVIHRGELVGASMSQQYSPTDVMMSMTAIRPEFRGRGIYSALTRVVLEATKQAGFQSVISKHRMNNNPILIAKLKLGFTIYGSEVHAVHGTLLKMVYHHNELMAKSQRFRSGELFQFDGDEIVEHYGGPLP